MNKKQFYLLSFTWGIILTLIGAIVAIVFICCGKKPERWGGCLVFRGKVNGGFNLGPIMVVDEDATDYTKNHEFGHAIQNCRYGPATLFIVHIPSFVHYWYRELRYARRGLTPPTSYYDIWFEKEASELGAQEIKNW